VKIPYLSLCCAVRSITSVYGCGRMDGYKYSR
jgi:hypothetical protein